MWNHGGCNGILCNAVDYSNPVTASGARTDRDARPDRQGELLSSIRTRLIRRHRTAALPADDNERRRRLG
jgi:hypothetical protein